MLVMVKSHENPMCAQNPMKNPIRLQDPKTKFEMAGPLTLATLDRPDGAQTVATENRQGTLWWRTMWGIYGEDPFFSFFFWGTHQSLAGLT